MDILNEALLKLKRLEGEIERLKTIEQPITAIGGWLEIPNGSWTYASSTTINVPSGAASIYAVGDQIRLKQGGAYKYFYIITVADTLLTVTGGSNYRVANAAITNAAFSKGGGVGHPGHFNYTPTVTYSGGTTDPTSITTYFNFSLYGKILIIRGNGGITRGSGDRTGVKFSYPFGTSMWGALSACIQYADIYWKYTRVQSDGLNIHSTAMSSDGNYWVTANCFMV